jgi:23S rRNA pseudouridine1911/1915/1917 synthase
VNPLAIEILCEDGPLLAVNKPAGLLTQGIAGLADSAEAQVKAYLKARYDKPGNVYLGIPHRLDRPVSGVLVVAKNSKAAARMAEQFRERTVRKWYLAAVEGTPGESSGWLVDWLLKDAAAAHVTVATETTPAAKRAELSYEIVDTVNGRSLLRIELHTGRMHQIRVQLASRGWPIIGDGKYGAATRFPDAASELTPGVAESAIALHAAELELKHPVRYDVVRLKAPVPDCWGCLDLNLPG